MTEWPAVPRFDRYQVSDKGEVKSTPADGKPRRTLKPEVGALGYVRVTLCQDNRRGRFLLHRLVWVAFRGEIPQHLQVNHVDGDKLNNSLANLEIVTASENVAHAFRTGLAKPLRGEASSSAKISAATVHEIRRRAAEGETHASLAAAFGLERGTISKIVRRERWSHLPAEADAWPARATASPG